MPKLVSPLHHMFHAGKHVAKSEHALLIISPSPTFPAVRHAIGYDMDCPCKSTHTHALKRSPALERVSFSNFSDFFIIGTDYLPRRFARASPLDF
jgi:hypothetical protein